MPTYVRQLGRAEIPAFASEGDGTDKLLFGLRNVIQVAASIEYSSIEAGVVGNQSIGPFDSGGNLGPDLVEGGSLSYVRPHDAVNVGEFKSIGRGANQEDFFMDDRVIFDLDDAQVSTR